LKPVVTPVEDQLRIGASPGVADLVISYDPVAGLTVSLQPKDDEEGSSPVLIVSTPATQPITQAAQVTGEGTSGSAAEGSVVRLTRLVPVPVVSVRPQVTAWLLQSGSLLSELVGTDIELEPGKDTAGEFAAGIIGREVATGRPVIIENQHGPADHEHLGQILARAATSKATTVIWVAEEFGESHRAALDWLNAHTDRTMRFFGLRLTAVTLEGAPAGLVAPHLELVVRPGSG